MLQTQTNVFLLCKQFIKNFHAYIYIQVSNRQTHYLQALINTMNLQINCQHLAGRVSYFLSNWEVLTQDQWVLQTVGGYQLELISIPHQVRIPHKIRCSSENMVLITTEVTELINKGAIIETQVVQQNFLSHNFFWWRKRMKAKGL